MQFTNTKEKVLMEYLKDQSFDDLIPLWNEFASDYRPDDYIFETIEETAEIAPNNDPLWLARAVYFGEIDNWSEPVKFNAYGNLENAYQQDLEYDALAEYLLDRYQFELVANIGKIEISTFVDNEDLTIALLNLVADYSIAKDLTDEETVKQMDDLKMDLEQNALFSWRVIE